MENEKYHEIEAIIKALYDELKPVFEEVKALDEDIIKAGDFSKQHPLSQLILRLTKTARRHNVEKKVIVEGHEVSVGTNHAGLGIEYSYSSQLEPAVFPTSYHNPTRDEQVVRDILSDGDAVIDLTAIIKKQNQKRFLKVMKVFRKYKLTKAFERFRNRELTTIKIDGTDDTQIQIDFNNYQIDFRIYKDDTNQGAFKVAFKDKSPTIIGHEEEESEVLKKISKFKTDEDIDNIKKGIFISQNKDAIVKALKEKRNELKSKIKDYKKERDELDEILKPFLALEKL